MNLNRKTIFIHGLESSGRGFKGKYFSKKIPDCLTPDFEQYTQDISYSELLDIRMKEINKILNSQKMWNIIGSSFGGLMGSIYTLKNPQKVNKLILLAPFLNTPILTAERYGKIQNPVIIFHGKSDEVVPWRKSKTIAQKLFNNLEYNLVDDDHMLHSTVKNLNWENLLK